MVHTTCGSPPVVAFGEVCLRRLDLHGFTLLAGAAADDLVDRRLIDVDDAELVFEAREVFRGDASL